MIEILASELQNSTFLF